MLRHRRDTLLEVDLTSVPVEPDSDDLLGRLRARNRPQLRPVLRALHEAGSDPTVAGLVAKVGGDLPWAVMYELRAAVEAFAAGGKPTLAWAESFGEGAGDLAAYTLASAFGEIWLQPGGGLGLLGVGVETTFLRDALDRIGVEPQLEQRYEYKNAADRIMRSSFTDAHRESVRALSASLFDAAVDAIARGRHMDAGEVRRLIDTGPRTAVEAHDAGLVDQLGYRDQVYAAMRATTSATAELLFAERWSPRRKPALPRRRQGHVALVDVRGAIVSGRSRRGPMGRQVGSDSVGAELRAALDDDGAKAVLLRVDSPGGSAVASDTIWREVVRVRESGKPVVVAMGEAAASGGYYVACPAHVIVAQPATLTGSIGVFGGKVVVGELLERVGLRSESVEQGARSLMYSTRRRFTDDELARLAASMDAIYDDFVAKVADGRHRTIDEIGAISRGRVWTGRDALGIGLVDELGGVRDAARIARSRAGLRDDAPVRPALRVPPLARLGRLGRPRNSEDPRALAGAVVPELPGIRELATAFGLPVGAALRMPDVRVR